MVLAEAAQHSLPHTSIAANAHQVSVWASQRNLSMVAAAAQHAQQLAEALAPLGAPEADTEKVCVSVGRRGGRLQMLLEWRQSAATDERDCHSAGRALQGAVNLW